MEDEGHSDIEIEGFKLGYRIREWTGFVAGIFLFIIGFIFIYNELARCFGWALLFVDK